MTNDSFKTTIISMLAVIALALCVIAGYLLQKHSMPAAPVAIVPTEVAPAPTPPPPAPVVAEAPQPVTAPPTPAPVPAPVPAMPVAPPPPVVVVRPRVAAAAAAAANIPNWGAIDNGCTTEVSGKTVHVTGTTNQDGWNHWNGVESTNEFPEGDFIASVDFKVPKFTGTGTPLVYLRVSGANNEAIGIFFRPGGMGYRVQSWSPAVYSAWLPRMGDEATAFHRMKLQYEAATQTATGWLDDKLIGDIKAPLTGKLKFQLVANTEKAGMDVDLFYENFLLNTAVTPPAGALP